jgi:hypothetical protein
MQSINNDNRKLIHESVMEVKKGMALNGQDMIYHVGFSYKVVD